LSTFLPHSKASGRRGSDCMVVVMQSVPIVTYVVSSIPTQRGVLDTTLCDTAYM